ncbi:ankyrin repeat domain-containing protein [Anaerocolumna sp. AGMB13020]|uniref:ankyrin repeat domain-containing protein n=1 Tax=Anaerocolumna sp. AGMB13020 TaxID=3081750 RepID=UPI0029535B6A|nr:ankyrin repeat domain-containing protein [Anaerocolumna sp. AGMB13020]WOO38734.1 ankyrin repeat domain-containing protein [Anaerocolumna sp. AGMB13020]
MKKIEDLWNYDVSEDIINGEIDHLRREIIKGWDVNEPLSIYAIQGKYMLPLMLAIKNNNLKSIQFLVEQGANLDIDPDHAFIFAMRYADEEVIRYLVNKGAKVKVYEKTYNAYDYITQFSREKYIPLAIEMGLPIIPYAANSLFREIPRNNFRMVEELLCHGMDINFNKVTSWNPLGNTPLCHAACYCDEKMVQFLIDHGADPSIQNKSRMRPYLIALKQGKIKNAQLLREYEPNKDGPDEKLIKKIPRELQEFLEKSDLKVYMPEKLGIEYLEFLSLRDLAAVNFEGRKGILLTRKVENYPDICLLWNSKKKCVSYYEMEHMWYGDFNVSFGTFMKEPERYLRGIFSQEFLC